MLPSGWLKRALIVALSIPLTSALAQTGRVRLVLFFSPTCPHCHQVIQNHFPMLFETYGGVPETQLAWGASEEEIALYYVSNDRIELLLVDVSNPVGADLFAASTEAFSLPQDRLGVPRLVIADTVLVGSLEIPTYLPGMVEEHLRTGGSDWPNIRGLQSAVAAIVGESQRLAESAAEDTAPEAEERVGVSEADVADDTIAATVAQQPEPEPEPEATSPAGGDTATVTEVETSASDMSGVEQAQGPGIVGSERPGAEESVDTSTGEVDAETAADDPAATGPDSLPQLVSADTPEPSIFDRLPARRASAIENFRNDPVGNAMSVIVLIGMSLCIVAVIGLPRLRSGGETLSPLVLVLAIAGIAVAGYLAYIETTGSLAVCGPIGDCNTVQQSPYARLFGLIPVGVVGALGYVVILVAWLISRFQATKLSDIAEVTIFSLSFIGTLFSVYLTFLEPFVIGATCAWCLTSSVIVTALMVLSVGPGVHAWTRLRRSSCVSCVGHGTD